MKWALRCLAPWIWWIASGLALSQPQGAAPGRVPPEAFYKPAKVEGAALSPSGRWLAFATGAPNGRNSLVVFDIESWRPLAAVAYYDDADIADFRWVGDERLVYSLIDRRRGGGDQVQGSGLFGVRRDGSETRALVYRATPRPSDRRAGREPLTFNHVLLAVPRAARDELIVGEVRVDIGGEFTDILAKRLDVSTGAVTNLAAGTPPNVWQWWFDPAGRARVIRTRRSGVDTLHWRKDEQGPWQVLRSFPSLAAPFAPVVVDGADKLFVVALDAAGYLQLRQITLGSDDKDEKLLVSTPGFDFAGHPLLDRDDGRLLGYRVLTDAEATVWSDAAMAALQKEADARWPAHVVRLDCARCAKPDMTVLARVWSDVDPGQYWVYRVESRQWRKLGDVRPEIDPAAMGRTSFHRIKARDGLEIPVWVTRPANPGDKPRPAVVLVHGGPWLRGHSWRWTADAQFLASRGYVVVEPEFRGSEGYGQALHLAGRKQWGRAMQDDVADALAWAVSQGWVDSKRACIAGASYGGYAVLMGLIRHPEAYRCGIAWAGVTDPRLMFEWMARSDMHSEFRQFHFPTLIGDPVVDAALLDSVTPVLHADRIVAPLLLAYGGSDERVPPVHGSRLRDALAKAGRPPEWVWYADEGHGWFKFATKVDFARRVEAFLARNLAD